jgi:hypothetical protein
MPLCENSTSGSVAWFVSLNSTFYDVIPRKPHVSCHAGRDRKEGGMYGAPTYRVTTGLNFISTFQLRTEDDKSKWILRGLALLGSIDWGTQGHL